MMQKENIVLPQLRFPEFVGNFKNIKFGEVIQSTLYGPRFNANDYNENGNVRTIRGTDLNNNGEIKYEQVPLAQLDEKMISTHKLIEGDIIMITTAECGATGVFRKQDIDYLSSAYGVRIRLSELGYPVFFKYFFQTWQAKREINKYIRKATVANLPGSDISRIQLSLPSFEEQQKIASFLTSIDTRIQQLEKKKTLLEQYKKGVMQKIFSQEIRFKDDDGKEFGKWEKKGLGDVSNITTGSSNRQDSSLTGAYTFFDRSMDIRTSSIYLFEGEAVIVAGEGSDFIPKYFVGKFDLHQRTYAIMDYKGANGRFLYYYIYYHRKYFLQQAVGSTVKSLRLPMFKKMPLLLPCLTEQTKIAHFLSVLDRKIAVTNRQIEKTKEWKKGMLQKIFV